MVEWGEVEWGVEWGEVEWGVEWGEVEWGVVEWGKWSGV